MYNNSKAGSTCNILVDFILCNNSFLIYPDTKFFNYCHLNQYTMRGEE